MGQVTEIKVDLPHPSLVDADWADCYVTEVSDEFDCALDAANAIVRHFPKWTYPALALRQVLVTPFGLKGSEQAQSNIGKVGVFPIITEEQNRVVAGMDDSHLNFRIVVDIVKADEGQRISLATLIKRHNLLGRIYLQTVLPFHRAIIRSALAGL